VQYDDDSERATPWDLPSNDAERARERERKERIQQGQFLDDHVLSSDSDAFSWIRFARAMKIAIKDEHRRALEGQPEWRSRN